MGQRLSTLKLILKQKNTRMDDNKVTLISKETDTDIVVSKVNSEDNGETHQQHFETIYTSGEQLNDTNTNTSSSTNPSDIPNNSTEPSLKLERRKSVELVICEPQPIEMEKKSSRKKHHNQNNGSGSKKKKSHWVLKFNCPRLKSGSSSTYSEPDIPGKSQETDCICTGYRRTEGTLLSGEDIPSSELPIFVPKQQLVELKKSGDDDSTREEDTPAAQSTTEPVIDLSKFNPENYPIEDCDERARLERAREIAEGVDPPPGFSPKHAIELVCPTNLNIDNLTALFQSALSLSALSQIDVSKSVHTQVDYMHCLVPDLMQIISSSFYWGKMDRYEAERLLDNKPEGTFLLRDSAQEEYLFSVSFRKYERSLHARIEQWNHRFSFDSHDPGVFSSPTVCGLIAHYKDPTSCMFFEPMLTIPLHRNFPFSLQNLCRGAICNRVSYDKINYLKLPKTLKNFLKEYHYKQRVRVRKFDFE